MDPKIHEGGDSSDSELLDNWTILDTDEAIDASLLADDEGDNEELYNVGVEAPRPKDDIHDEPADENCDSLKEDSIGDQEKNSLEVPLESDTDGVSIIADSDDEVEELEVEPVTKEHAFQPLIEAEVGRTSPGSKSQSELSDLSNQDLPIDLGQKGERQYVHYPNPKVNLFLNAMLVVVFASVIGLGVGHFMGLHEECHVPKFAEVTEVPLTTETWTLLNSLSHENDLLKMQLKQLQNSLGGKKNNWPQGQVVMEPLLIKNEDETTPEEVIDPCETLAEDVEEVEVPEAVKPEEKEQSDAAPSIPIELPLKTQQAASKEQNFHPAAPYTDEQLENHQTRFAKLPETPKPATEPKPKKSTPPVDSFYDRVEAELQNVVQKVSSYGSSIVRNRNIPNSVTSGLGMLTATISDLQQSIKSLHESTAQQRSYMVENVKKSVSKMVSNVKHTAEKLTKGQPRYQADVWKNLHKLKASVVNGWCHIKGKLNQGNPQECYLNNKKNDTKYQKGQVETPGFKKEFDQQKYAKVGKRYDSKNACYKGRCSYENSRYRDQYRNEGDWQFKRAKFRNEGRQKDVSNWYNKVDGRHQQKNYYEDDRKWFRSRGY